MKKNTYLEEIKKNLPRALSLIDSDRSSQTYGIGDRYYWAWGLIDFGNGTFQGMANGLARLWKNDLWPYLTPKKTFINRIDSLFIGAKYLTNRDGSLQESFPNEGSYCVTALVAFDLICTIDLMKDDVNSETINRWTKIVKPMIKYLVESDETHAIISNHLATSVAALVLWCQLGPDHKAEKKARELLKRILLNQSSEGWFNEYGGADPGYQSLCIYYLSFVHAAKPEWGLEEPLRRSSQFLSYCAHPDGSFGGYYGSRYTRFYYPSGLLSLSHEDQIANSLSMFMAKSIDQGRVVNLSSIDEPNFVPMFNSYCHAATLSNSSHKKSIVSNIPINSNKSFSKIFFDSGLYFEKGKNYYTIINLKKGGTIYHFKNNVIHTLNTGIIIKNKFNRIGSSNSKGSFSFSKDERTVKAVSQITTMPKKVTRPWQFLVLRILNLTFLRSYWLRELFKQFLVKFLIKENQPWKVSNIRTIKLGKNLSFYDDINLPKGYKIIDDQSKFVPIHMASQGYWQIQDEDALK